MKDDDISIVTVFFDIGRGSWTKENGFADHLQCTTDKYFQRFAYLASLENEMVIYTSPDLAPRVVELRKGKEDKTTVLPLTLNELFPQRIETIRRVQLDPAYRAKINPSQISNPEYNSPEYVLLMNLKAFFVTHAVQNNLVHNRQVAWLDFGYCRGAETLGGCTHWRYSFTPGKVNLFAFSDYKGEISLGDIVANNIVYVAGAALVAEKYLWPAMAQLMNKAADELLVHNLVDDDQILLLMASLYRPDLFERHIIPDQQWQPVLRMFNNNTSHS